MKVDAVLFDLDGTIVDSAPDIAGAANALRESLGLAPMPLEALRPMVGAGARGMVGSAFGKQPGDDGYEALREGFLRLYERGLLERTQVFAAMVPVLAALDAAALRWGIVTNKVERFARPIVDGLGLGARAAALVCGDTTPHAKPHPEPLLEAARRIGVHPARCVYVGDDHRDAVAGRAAGMAVLAAGWGYLGEAAPIADWGAEAVLAAPIDLLRWLGLA